VLAACACARLALPHTSDPRVIVCIETTEAWARGEATIGKVNDVRVAANTVAAAAAHAAHAAAARAAAAAAYAASDASAADYAAAAAAAARKGSLAESADIVRSLISWADISAAVSR